MAQLYFMVLAGGLPLALWLETPSHSDLGGNVGSSVHSQDQPEGAWDICFGECEASLESDLYTHHLWTSGHTPIGYQTSRKSGELSSQLHRSIDSRACTSRL